jgi:hypothetical protein
MGSRGLPVVSLADVFWSACFRPPAASFSRLEPYGIPILIGLLIVLPALGAQFGIDLSIVSWVLHVATGAVIDAIIRFTGNT